MASINPVKKKTFLEYVDFSIKALSSGYYTTIYLEGVSEHPEECIVNNEHPEFCSLYIRHREGYSDILLDASLDLVGAVQVYAKALADEYSLNFIDHTAMWSNSQKVTQ